MDQILHLKKIFVSFFPSETHQILGKLLGKLHIILKV